MASKRTPGQACMALAPRTNVCPALLALAPVRGHWARLVPGSASAARLLSRLALGQQLPSLHTLRRTQSGPAHFVRALLGYHGALRLPQASIQTVRPLAFSSRSGASCSPGGSWDPPVPARGVSVHAELLRPRPLPRALAMASAPVLPSAPPNGVGTAEVVLSRLDRSPALPPVSTLQPRPYLPRRMTRGRDGSLCLPVWLFHPLPLASLLALSGCPRGHWVSTGPTVRYQVVQA
jgi:hypothetical protein